MASVSDQSNELSVLDGDDGSVSPDFLYHILKGLTGQLEYFQLFSTWIMHICTPQKHRATITIFTSLYIKFKYYFSVITQRGSSNAA